MNVVYAAENKSYAPVANKFSMFLCLLHSDGGLRTLRRDHDDNICAILASILPINGEGRTDERGGEGVVVVVKGEGERNPCPARLTAGRHSTTGPIKN